MNSTPSKVRATGTVRSLVVVQTYGAERVVPFQSAPPLAGQQAGAGADTTSFWGNNE